MRRLILKAIIDLKAIDGFDRGLMRWNRMEFKGQHWSKVEFLNLNDEDLLSFYTSTVRQYSKQF